MRILAHRFPELQDQVAKFNKKALKWNLPPVEVTVLETKVEERSITTRVEGEEVTETYRVEVLHLEITGQTPRIAGWSIHSKIQPSDVKGQNFVFTTQNHKQDETLRYKPLFCDHCQSARLKKTGYWIEHEDGRKILVGATCLKDFLPAVNIESLLQYLDNFSKIGLGDDDEDRPPRGEWLYPTRDAIADALRSIQLRGFVSKTKAQDTFVDPTSIDINPGPKVHAEMFKGVDFDAHYKLVDECIAFLKALNDGTDFFYNVKLAVASEYVKPKLHGYLAAAVSIWLRDVAAQREKGAGELNEWWGTVGARITLRELRLTYLTASEGIYGTTYIHRFLDKEGRLFVWFGSKELGPTGQTYNVKATIKKHDVYNGRKQTIIARCNEV
jgi:hypothetical protein